MNAWQTLGTYLDRSVTCGSMATSDILRLSNAKGLSGAVVLVVFGEMATVQDMQRWIDKLADQSPVAILVAGHDSGAAFDYLLRSLSTKGEELTQNIQSTRRTGALGLAKN